MNERIKVTLSPSLPAVKLKLYIWNDPYPVDYGSSLVFAVAENLREAKRIASKSTAYAYGQYKEHTQQVKLEKPTRVLDIPCGEWHRWQE